MGLMFIKNRRFTGLYMFLFIIAFGFASGMASAQFNSGSTGQNGAFPPIAVPDGTTEITVGMITGDVTFLPGGTVATMPNVPAGGFQDGVIHFTTIDIPAGVTVTFLQSVCIPVTMLAQGNVNIAGTVDVSGRNGNPIGGSGGGLGGPAGFQGGTGELNRSNTQAGTGFGPGGGQAGGFELNTFNPDTDSGGGGGGYASAGAIGAGSNNSDTKAGKTYGIPNLLPLVGGSGGGGGTHGGTAADQAGGGGGSGGAIRLMTNTLQGTGTISTDGGAGGVILINDSNSADNAGGKGGDGRIRLEVFNNNFTGTITGAATNGIPGPMVLPNSPTVRITTINGNAVPVNTIGCAGGIDVAVAAAGILQVGLEAANVPLGTTINVTAKSGDNGVPIGPVTSTALTGTVANSTATVDIPVPAGGAFFLESRINFTIP